MFVSRGFKGKRRNDNWDRIPSGQHFMEDFPVLTAGPTQEIALSDWRLTIDGLVDAPRTWSFKEIERIGLERFKVDIHCVTTWSKLDTRWEGISIQRLLDEMTVDADASHAFITSYGGYTTNVPLEDLLAGKAFVGFRYENFPLTSEHGGPARLVVPHLYFWKSAKWIKRIDLRSEDQRGFWEEIGYHDYGDPWKEQRYHGD